MSSKFLLPAPATLAAQQAQEEAEKEKQQQPDLSASSRSDVVEAISDIFGHESIFHDCGNDGEHYRNLLRDRIQLLEKGDDPPPKLLRACQRYVARFKKRVEILERRGGESAEAHQRRTHWASRAAFFFDRPFATRASLIYFIIQTAIIVFSCIAVILQSVPRFNPQLFSSFCVFWAQGDILSSGLLLIDRAAQIVAGILDPEGGPGGLWKRCKVVLFQISVWIDVLACIVPLILALSVSCEKQGADGSPLDLVVLLRVYRILMSLRHFDAFEDLMDTLRSSAPALAAPLVGLFVILFGVSSIVFTFEGGSFDKEMNMFMTKVDDCVMSAQYLKGRTECDRVESKFVSAVHTIWFTLITFLTVGYGDLVPLTQSGRLVAAVAIFIGMLFVAIPIAIVGSNFTETVERLRTERLLVVQWMEREKETPKLAETIQAVHDAVTTPAPIPSLSFLRFLRMNLKKTTLNLKNPPRTARYLCELYFTRVAEVFRDPCNAHTLRLVLERSKVTKRPYSARLQLVGTSMNFPPLPLMRPVSVSLGSAPTCDIMLCDATTRKLRGATVGGMNGKRLVRIPQMIASRHALVSLLPFAGTAETAKVEPVAPFQACLVGKKGNRIHFANNEDATIFLTQAPPPLTKKDSSAALKLLADEDDSDEDVDQSEDGVPYGVSLEFGRKFSLIQI